jgi:hypothetical protein
MFFVPGERLRPLGDLTIGMGRRANTVRGAGLAQPLNLLKRPEPEKSDKLSILPHDTALFG